MPPWQCWRRWPTLWKRLSTGDRSTPLRPAVRSLVRVGSTTGLQIGQRRADDAIDRLRRPLSGDYPDRTTTRSEARSAAGAIMSRRRAQHRAGLGPIPIRAACWSMTGHSQQSALSNATKPPRRTSKMRSTLQIFSTATLKRSFFMGDA